MLNKHIPHLEELILENGSKGLNEVLSILDDLRDIQSGYTGNKTKVKSVTVKYDGSPSVFVGIDPEDGKFFVAKKSIFNKEPEVYKSTKDIYEKVEGRTLQNKLYDIFLAFEGTFSHGIYQGDLLFASGDIFLSEGSVKDIIAFQTNTILYWTDSNSPISENLDRAKVGIAFHTSYTGDSLNNLKAEYGSPISHKFKGKNLWAIDVTYKHSGESDELAFGGVFRTSMSSLHNAVVGEDQWNCLDFISSNEELVFLLKKFYNDSIRKGDYPSYEYLPFFNYVNTHFNKEIDSKKSKAGKEKWTNKKAEFKTLFNSHGITMLEYLFTVMGLVNLSKNVLIESMNKNSQIGTFVQLKDGTRKKVGHEGYVVTTDNHVVKLVNRLEFSYNNFNKNVVKGFER